jgi:RNase P protein component
VPKEYRKQVKEWTESASYKMDLTIVIPKRIGKLSTTRTRTRTRIRSAIRQIVQYGITTQGADSVVYKKVGPAHWLLPGWTYVFHPSLEVLLLPQEILVNKVAAGLRSIKVRSHRSSSLSIFILMGRFQDKGIEARTLYRAEKDLEIAEEQVAQSVSRAASDEPDKATLPEAGMP